MSSSENDDFRLLNKITASFGSLQIFGATHSNALSAFCEFVDNAYDAGATTTCIDYIYTKSGPQLEFLDNGRGMSPTEILDIISFGSCLKTNTDIGIFGNGLKSGAFKLGQEVFVLTKKRGVYSALLISSQFHTDKNLVDSIYVSCPSFDRDFIPIVKSEEERTRVELEMEILNSYAPLLKDAETVADKRAELENLFKRLKSHGTLVIVSRLSRCGLGELVIKAPHGSNDLRIEVQGNAVHTSLRDRLSRLYLWPKTEIFLRGSLVEPKKVCQDWIGKTEFTVYGMTSRQQDTLSDEYETVRTLKIRHEAVQKRIQRASNAIVLNKLKDERKQILIELKNTEKTIKDEKSQMNKKVVIRFGLEVKDRSNDGIHFYINNRLIIWGYKNLPFFKTDKLNSLGVSAYVNLESYAYRASLDKQSFAISADFNALLVKIKQRLCAYYIYLESFLKTHLEDFWNLRQVQEKDKWAVFWQCYGFPNYNSQRPVNRQHAIREPLSEMKSSMIQRITGERFICVDCRVWKRFDPETAVSENPSRCQDLFQRCQHTSQYREHETDKEDFIPLNYVGNEDDTIREIINSQKGSTKNARSEQKVEIQGYPGVHSVGSSPRRSSDQSRETSARRTVKRRGDDVDVDDSQPGASSSRQGAPGLPANLTSFRIPKRGQMAAEPEEPAEPEEDEEPETSHVQFMEDLLNGLLTELGERPLKKGEYRVFSAQDIVKNEAIQEVEQLEESSRQFMDVASEVLPHEILAYGPTLKRMKHLAGQLEKDTKK